MAKITAQQVNELRKMTGAGMMDCKKALVETDGDKEKAIDILRKKGQKLASKRADRSANEGFVIAKTNEDASLGVVLVLNCETDFVAKNEEFQQFVHNVADKAIENKIQNLDSLNSMDFNTRTVSENLLDLVGKFGEKMEFSTYENMEAPMVFAYNHQGNKLATIMGLNKSKVENIVEIGRNVNMQIAAMAPIAIDKDGIDATVVEKEIEIGKEQAREEGKPEAMLEKIAMGKLGKFYKENTLLNQQYVRDNKISVKQYLETADKELTVVGFKRVNLV